VVLDGLNNILKKSGAHTDEVCQKIEECGGSSKSEFGKYLRFLKALTKSNTCKIMRVKKSIKW
jgi:hypothetical protein